MYFFFNTTFESRYVSGRPKISSEGERNNNTQQFEYGRLQLTLTLMMPRFRSVSPGIFFHILSRSGHAIFPHVSFGRS